MRSGANSDQKTRQALQLAQLSCLVFGAGLLVWGLTPIFVLRIASREPPQLGMFAASGVTVLLGAVFVGLCVLIRRGVRWALWGAIYVSLGLLVVILAGSVWGGRTPSVFPLVLASSTGLTSWLAIPARNTNDAADAASLS